MLNIQDQMNAIQKHVNRNGLTVDSWMISTINESTGLQYVYGMLTDGSYLTVFMLMNKDYADLIQGTSGRSYASILY